MSGMHFVPVMHCTDSHHLLAALSLWPRTTVFISSCCLYDHVLLSLYLRAVFMTTYCCLYGHVLSVWPRTVCMPRTTVFICPCCLYGYMLSTLDYGGMLRTQKLGVSLLAAELLSFPCEKCRLSSAEW